MLKREMNEYMPSLLLSNRNEDTSQYFEKIFSAIEFSKLLKLNSSISHIELKPDRKYGAKRRIEDLTRFMSDKSIEVVQLKYSDDPNSRWVYSDLWKKKITIQSKKGKNNRYEGTSIFKFFKSWEHHKGQQKNVKLFLTSNKPLGKDLKKFYGDIQKLRKSKLNWNVFSKQYDNELKNIKANLFGKKLKKGELEAFIKSLEFKLSKKITKLDDCLTKELGKRGISDKDRIDAFITRTFRKFTKDEITVRKADVEEMLELVKTGLIHEIDTPKNYIYRKDLEEKILNAVEKKRKKGGFVFLFAPSGSGKTVLLSNLTKKNEDFIPYLCRIRPFEKSDSTINYQKERLSSKWFKVDLIQRLFELGLIKETVGVKDDENGIDVVFGRILKQVSDSALKRRNKKIVIIIDALDQIDTDKYKGKSILNAIPPIEYPGVVFLLSTWGEKYLPRQINGDKISVDLGFVESEIKEYFSLAKIKLTPDQVRKVLKKTKGLAISLLYFAQKLKRTSRNKYDEIIESRHEYKEVFDWYKPIWGSLNNKQRHCLGCLSFHFTEVQKNKLYEIAKIGLNNFSVLSEKISPFVNFKGGRIEPYHDSFRRFIVNKLKGSKKEHHKEIIKYYAKSDNQKLLYSRKYLTKHLSAVGLNDSFIKKISERLLKELFIEKIITSRLDCVSKIDSAKYFIKYLNNKGDVEKFIKYAIQISNINPRINDDDVFLKGRIGTANLLREVEDSLSIIQNSSVHSLRDWIFKRIQVGNLLKRNDNPVSEKLAVRFLEDGLARISFNPDILWSSDFINSHNYWDTIQEYLEAHVNLGRYHGAVKYITNIRFKNLKSSNVGFRANLLVVLNRLQYQKDKNSVLSFIKNLPQSLQLITYTYLYLEQNDSEAGIKAKALLKKPILYKYLTSSKSENQNVDLAEATLILKISSHKVLAKKLVQNLKFDIPYYSHNYSYWGVDSKNLFLRRMAILSIVEKDFDAKAYYIDLLKKDRKEHYEDYNNDSFASIVEINILLLKHILLVRRGEVKWKEFRDFLYLNLNIFKTEIIKAKNLNQLQKYPLNNSAYVYYENSNSFIGDSLYAVAKYFPKNLESFVLQIEKIFSNTILEKNHMYSEVILSHLLPSTFVLKKKIADYQKIVFSNKRKEKADNIEKSSSLKDFAEMMSKKGYKELAENIYRHSLKYSHGIWGKEDLRVFNLIDCLKTRTKPEEFRAILKHIDKIGEALEGSWYYKIAFIESVTYADYELALDFFIELVRAGEINLNEGLKNIILTSLSRYPYKDIISELLPLLDILRFDEVIGYKAQENIQSIYHVLVDYSLRSNRDSLARVLLDKYFVYLKRYVYVVDRLKFLEELLNFVKEKKSLKTEYKKLLTYIEQLKKDGYSAGQNSESNHKIIPDTQLNQVKSLARKKSMKKIISLLDDFVNDNSRYKVEELVSHIIPSLNVKAINVIREWCKKNNVDFITHAILTALLEFSIQNTDSGYFKQTKRDILAYCKNSSQLYSLEEMVNKLDGLEFDGKRQFIKKLIRCSIERASGDSYYLNSFIYRTSKMIDKYYPELKELAYHPLKKTVENSMKLSLSKS